MSLMYPMIRRVRRPLIDLAAQDAQAKRQPPVETAEGQGTAAGQEPAAKAEKSAAEDHDEDFAI